MVNKKYFLAATKEVEQGNLDEALWAKQLAVAKGDEEKAKYEYIAERATTLQKDAITRFFNPILKKYIPRLLILAGSLFVILLIIDNSNQRKAETQRIENAKIQTEIEAAVREARIKKEEVEKEKAEQEEEERAEEEERLRIANEESRLAFENSLNGLKCVIETDRYKETYDPFYLIVNDDKESNTWGKTVNSVFWQDRTRLKYSYPVIFNTYAMWLQGNNSSIDRNWYQFSTTRQILTGRKQSKLEDWDYTYEKIKNVKLDRDTLKFYLTIDLIHRSEVEVIGNCTKISYTKVLEIVDQAQINADPDGLFEKPYQ
ncbi:hypothetical protein N9X63_04030 [Woeseiaceae bacterium]|nr:hypothetical protein [Woeseiaceae bacterium]